MFETAPEFNRAQLGKVAIKLQSVCNSCSHNSDCRPFKGACAIGSARKILGDYLRNKEQVVPDFDISSFPPIPYGLEFDKKRLELAFSVVHDLCNKCMFHVDKCFLNLAYTCIEVAIYGEQKKRLSTKPGDQVLE